MKLLDRLFRRTFRFHVPNGQDVAFEVKGKMCGGQVIKWFEFRGLEDFVQPGEQVSIETLMSDDTVIASAGRVDKDRVIHSDGLPIEVPSKCHE